MTSTENFLILSQNYVLVVGWASCLKTLSFVVQAAALVEEETRRYRPTKNYLSYMPAPDFSTFEVRNTSVFETLLQL